MERDGGRVHRGLLNVHQLEMSLEFVVGLFRCRRGIERGLRSESRRIRAIQGIVTRVESPGRMLVSLLLAEHPPVDHRRHYLEQIKELFTLIYNGER